MQEKILTIVIPSYNTEEFIAKNVNTMLNHSINDMIEILIINDGSSDRTQDEAEKLQDKFPNTVRVINKLNGGHGSVINRGILEATGKYFKVIDGDDFVNTEEFIKFVNLLREVEADCILNDYNTVSAISGAINRHQASMNPQISFYNRLYKIDDIINDVNISIHAITYKTQILKNYYKEIKVLEKVFYEDIEYSTYPIIFMENIYTSELAVYQYVIDQKSQSVSTDSHKKNIEHSKLGIKTMTEKYIVFRNSLSDPKSLFFKRMISDRINGVYGIYLSFHNDRKKYWQDLVKFDKSIKNISSEVYNYSNNCRLVRFIRNNGYIAFLLSSIIFK